jgi:hypothetical protein
MQGIAAVKVKASLAAELLLVVTVVADTCPVGLAAGPLVGKSLHEVPGCRVGQLVISISWSHLFVSVAWKVLFTTGTCTVYK